MDVNVLLIHPETLEASPCRVTVARRGLLLARTVSGPLQPIPWWAVRGLSADGTASGPDGRLLQALEVLTDAGVLTLAAPAADVADLLSGVARYSGSWRRARRPAVAALARVRALLSADALRLLWRAFGPMVLWVVATPVGRAGVAAHAAWRSVCRRWRVIPVVSAAASMTLLVGGVGALTVPGGPGAASASAPAPLLADGQPDTSTMAGMAGALGGGSSLDLTPATSAPAPAPPSLAEAAPLQPHEIFGFAPYWTLDLSAGFNVADLTTIAYFSVDVNADGSLDESGPGWEGYESQQLADLVTRAHAAGARVVLTVTCFDQSTLDQLTSSPSAPARLAAAILSAVEAKNLDGVNIDFEGQGSADQAGLTNLVTQVSETLHGADPHYQVTMDTYATSAGDPSGFYDIAALAPEVDAFFVMAYQLNLQATAQATSPLTSGMFSDLSTIEQYVAAVAAGKVILGTPYYGYDWPTNGNGLDATATGPPTTVSYAQVVGSGDPVYWDSVTDTAWTSYQVGSQWHETFFEDPSSLYLEAQMSQFFHLAGLGIWALGMDGNDSSMLSALLGFAPAVMDSDPGPSGAETGPTTTTTSSVPSPGATTTTTTTPVPTGASSPTVPATTTTEPATTTTEPATTTTTTAGAGTAGSGTDSGDLRYAGLFDGTQVSLNDETSSASTVESGIPTYVGLLTDFTTNDPTLSCLESAASLDVWQFSGTTSQYVVVAQTPTDCVDAVLTFSPPTTGSTGGSTSSAPDSTESGGGASATSAVPASTTSSSTAAVGTGTTTRSGTSSAADAGGGDGPVDDPG